MVEYTSQHEDSVEITKGVTPGENFVAQGAEAKRGSLLLDRGTRLNEAAIALAASVGKSRLQVFVRPRVAVLTTGDEIVDVDAQIGPTQIRNSNSYSLAAQIQKPAANPYFLPIAPDEPRRLRQLIEEGLQSDLLIMTGGVSMGRYDLVEQVLAELQAEFFFTGAKIQPGRPVVFGRVPCGAGAPAREGRTAPVSPAQILLRPARQSSLHHGHLRTVCPPHARSPGRNIPAPTHIPACPSEIRNPHQDWTNPIPPRDPFRRIRQTRMWNSCPGRDQATSPPNPARIATSYPARPRALSSQASG